MKAAWYERLGPAAEVLRVGELPTPEPAAGEVRVRLACSGVNPSDVKSRRGLRSPVMPFARVVPHSDGAGIVDAVGEGVPQARVGERVWTWNAAWGRPWGTAAEYVCLPAGQAVPLPDATGFEAGACLGIPALTALHAVLCEGGVAGQAVLVAGGSGAVGHCAVQLASRLGAARVIATVGSAAKAGIARAAGADDVILYRDEPVAERVREITAGRGVDRVIEVDLGANGALDLDILRTGGACVAYGSSQATAALPFYPLIAKNLKLACFIVYHLERADRERATATLGRLLARGELELRIDSLFPLERIAEAHERVERGNAVGNVVVRLPG